VPARYRLASPVACPDQSTRTVESSHSRRGATDFSLQRSRRLAVAASRQVVVGLLSSGPLGGGAVDSSWRGLDRCHIDGLWNLKCMNSRTDRSRPEMSAAERARLIGPVCRRGQAERLGDRAFRRTTCPPSTLQAGKARVLAGPAGPLSPVCPPPDLWEEGQCDYETRWKVYLRNLSLRGSRPEWRRAGKA
jgi:hypothetical protein